MLKKKSLHWQAPLSLPLERTRMTPAIPIMVNIVLYNILLLQFFARLEMFHAVIG
jgi:hypothetical protein